MVKKTHGSQYKTRNKLKKSPREKGKVSVDKYMQEFKVGDKVVIKPEPSVKKNLPHHRVIRTIGEVTGKTGNAYNLEVRVGNAIKKVSLLPIHLKKL